MPPAHGDSPRAPAPETLDRVLDTVKDHASGAPLSHTGLVERFRFQPDRRRLLVFFRPRRTDHACCLLVNEAATDRTLRDLRRELELRFPDLEVEFVFLET